MVYIIPNFLDLQLGENIMKINTKIAVTVTWKFALKCEWKHVFIHIFMQIFMSFYEGQLMQQMLNTLLISYMVLNPLEWQFSSFRPHQTFPI